MYIWHVTCSEPITSALNFVELEPLNYLLLPFQLHFFFCNWNERRQLKLNVIVLTIYVIVLVRLWQLHLQLKFANRNRYCTHIVNYVNQKIIYKANSFITIPNNIQLNVCQLDWVALSLHVIDRWLLLLLFFSFCFSYLCSVLNRPTPPLSRVCLLIRVRFTYKIIITFSWCIFFFFIECATESHQSFPAVLMIILRSMKRLIDLNDNLSV